MADPGERMEAEYAAFYHATGELVREWANFELHMAFTLSTLLCVDGFRARVVLGSTRSFDAKRRLLLQLGATFLSDHANDKLVSVMQRAKAMARNRNMIAHQLGGVDERVNRLVFCFGHC